MIQVSVIRTFPLILLFKCQKAPLSALEAFSYLQVQALHTHLNTNFKGLCGQFYYGNINTPQFQLSSLATLLNVVTKFLSKANLGRKDLLGLSSLKEHCIGKGSHDNRHAQWLVTVMFLL